MVNHNCLIFLFFSHFVVISKQNSTVVNSSNQKDDNLDRNTTTGIEVPVFKLFDESNYGDYYHSNDEHDKKSNYSHHQDIDNNAVIFKLLITDLNGVNSSHFHNKVHNKFHRKKTFITKAQGQTTGKNTLKIRKKREDVPNNSTTASVYLNSSGVSGKTTKYGPPDNETNNLNTTRVIYINPEIAELFRNLSEIKSPCDPVLAEYNSQKYRSIDGSYNNLKHPEWGMAMSYYKRMVYPVYADDVSSPRKSCNRKELPNPRLLVTKLCLEGQKTDRMRSLLAMQWGKFVAHDMSKFMSIEKEIDCCSPKNTSELLCYPIKYPPNDKLSWITGIDCQDFTRTITDKIYGCNDNSEPARQINTVTAYLDLSTIYGNDVKTSKSLRSMKGGQLLTEQTDYTILPPIEKNLNSCFCNRPGEKICFKTGDSRCNKNPQLVILHTVLMREHNRIAGELSRINPLWKDETLFQEARRINIAQYQNIIYYEWLPDLIGWKNLAHADVIFPSARDYVDDYNPDVHPAIINEFATAVFTHCYSEIPGEMHLVDKDKKVQSVESKNDWFYRPQILYNIDKLEQLTFGLLEQKCEKCDNLYAKEVTNSVYKCGNKRFLRDFKSMVVQRDRDHGLAYYNQYRSICGLGAATSFDGFLDFIPKESVDILRRLYKSHEDVDLSIGGALEKHWNGAEVGPTFLCIMIQQFKHIRIADRFFFESPSSGFTIEQLNEIRKTSISRIFCDSADAVEDIQLNGFLNIPEHSVLPCEVIPKMNLTKWKATR